MLTYQQLRGFASRQPCNRPDMENGFCVSFGDEVTWGVTCGDTRVNVVLDRDRNLLSFGLSNVTTDFCGMTAVQTVPARGGTTLTEVPWYLADGGMHPSL